MSQVEMNPRMVAALHDISDAILKRGHAHADGLGLHWRVTIESPGKPTAAIVRDSDGIRMVFGSSGEERHG